MIKMNRPFAALLLALAANSCVDVVGPEDSGGFSLQLAVVGPQAVSQDEMDALGDVFDLVDRYTVVIVDSLTQEVLVVDTIDITPGGLLHTLDIHVPDDLFGRRVTITLIAYVGGNEVYRSVHTASFDDGVTATPIELEIRYTGPGVRGTISDANGDPVGDVSVGLFEGASMIAAVSTEIDGTYLFVDVPLGTYDVQPTPPGSSFVCPGFRTVTVASASDAIVADFGTSGTVCGTSVLVVSGGDFNETDIVETMLSNDPNLAISTFFYVNQLPGIDLLKQYDIVLLFMNGLFDESVALGTEIADYVNLGGNVVIGSFYWQGRSDGGLGSPGWGALEAVDPFASDGGATYTLVTLDTNTLVAHPLTVGVNTLTSTVGYSSGVTARSGTIVVASWSDGAPLVGYRVLSGGQRIVAVSLFPAAGASATGDTQALWENAVNWAGAAGGPAPVGGG